MGSLGVGHDWATSLSLFTFMHWRRKWQPTPVFLPGESQGRGAWWAAVSGVAQSRTRLKWLSRLSNSLVKLDCVQEVDLSFTQKLSTLVSWGSAGQDEQCSETPSLPHSCVCCWGAGQSASSAIYFSDPQAAVPPVSPNGISIFLGRPSEPDTQMPEDPPWTTSQ